MKLKEEKDVLNHFLLLLKGKETKIDLLEFRKILEGKNVINYFKIMLENFSRKDLIEIVDPEVEAIILDRERLIQRVELFLSGPKEPQIAEKEVIFLEENEEAIEHESHKTIKDKPELDRSIYESPVFLGPIKIDPEKIPLILSYPPSFHGKIKHLVNKFQDLSIFNFSKFVSYAFNKAKSEILICNPFIDFNGICSIFSDVLDLVEKNIKLKILTRNIIERDTHIIVAQSENKVKGILKLLDIYKSEGKIDLIEIRDFEIGFRLYSQYTKHYEGIHQKMIIIDDKLCYIGSSEIRGGSLLNNGDIGCVFTDPGYIQFFKEFFYVFWDADESLEIKYDDLRKLIKS